MRVCIVFASMSGNTEDIAVLIKRELETNLFQVDLEEMDGYSASEILAYDAVLIGSYTWGDGDLPYEAEDFDEELAELQLNGMLAGVFGSGDRVYPSYCEAVHIFEKSLSKCGATIVCDKLEIEFDPNTDADREACKRFANQLVQALMENVTR
ncbi:flavodoxin [Bacillus sp. JCM 19046]|uniref:Flavodoxin n=1 Tax=Shouchella xiaoxiensis TaxID=766895 RepID=A0ABS2SU13_9BACI|nr:flavodoxin [Shouchella xiaoxiensis]MBM7839033.1 flavodoxin I [Shouchella xiaoxiensis]GAF15450.1 flavodoxin [Bacillus sp. JCM 19045]GAF19916.1 flavodoxin [Bacillus sp. JCM 19046]